MRRACLRRDLQQLLHTSRARWGGKMLLEGLHVQFALEDLPTHAAIVALKDLPGSANHEAVTVLK